MSVWSVLFLYIFHSTLKSTYNVALATLCMVQWHTWDYTHIQVADLEGQISCLETERSRLQSDLTSSQEGLEAAQDDAKKFAELATETQSVYQHELMQHGKSMESLFALKEQVHCLWPSTCRG